MHYYQFNIGDYRRQTGHLSLVEHGIYRSLLDTYYLTEEPLCADHAKIMRSHSIRTEEERTALVNVLSDFFELTEDGYHQASCHEQIDKYREKSEKAKKSANARWKGANASKSNANALRTVCGEDANHKPITNNHKPITTNQEPLVKDKVKRFVKPTPEELVAHFELKQSNSVEAEKFFNYYESNGWKVGKNPMKKWKAAAANWMKNNTQPSPTSPAGEGYATAAASRKRLTDTDW